MRSKFLEAFKRVAEFNKADYQLIGDCILVEEIKPEEMKTKSGIVLPSGASKMTQIDGFDQARPVFAHVLAVGEGYYDEDGGEDVPLNVNPGDIVLIGKNSAKWFSTFGGLVSSNEHTIGLVREAEVQMKFTGQTGYDAVFAQLNKLTDSNQT